MNPAGLCVALSMINLRHAREEQRVHWAIKAQILMLIASADVGEIPAELSQREVSERLKRSRTTACNALAELVEDRVLHREEVGGNVGHLYRINPDVRQWRNVPWYKWLIPDVEREVGFATGEFARGDFELSRVAYSARQQRFVARHIHRATENFSPRDKRDLSRGIYNARQPDQPSRGNPGFLDHKSDTSQGSSSDSGFDVVNESLSREQRETFNKVAGSLARKVGARWGRVRGKPATALTELIIAGATTEQLLELVAALPPDCQVQSGVEWLSQQWHAVAVDVMTGMNQQTDRDALVKSRETALRMIATWENEGDEEIVLEWKQKLSEIDRKLSALDNDDVVDDDDRSMEA